MEYRLLRAAEIERIREIDRSERVTTRYRVRDGALVPEQVDWVWEGWGHEDLDSDLERVARCLADGGAVWGAFAGARLGGVAVLDGRPMRAPVRRLDLYYLYVDAAFRDQGVGRRLVELTVTSAIERGAAELYVSATASQHTVHFYRGQGFRVVTTPDAELFALEPEDVHMVRALRS